MERGGYVYLDVRPALELAEVGCVPGSFNIPVVDAEWVDGDGERRVVKTRNEAFLDQVRPAAWGQLWLQQELMQQGKRVQPVPAGCCHFFIAPRVHA